MEGYNGKKRPYPYRENSSRSFIPKKRRNQRQFISTIFTTLPSRTLSMDELIKMSGEEPDDLILNLKKEMKVFLSMLEDETIEHKLMARILMVFGKASTSRLQSEVNTLISSLSNCKMFYSIHVPQYLASLHQLGLSDDDSKSLEMLTELLIKFHHYMPCTAMDTTSVLFPLLENTVKMFLSQNENLSSLLEMIVETNMKNQEFQKSIKPKEVKYKTAKERLQLQKPPENYRTIPILPTPDDIHRPCSFLRPNLTKGEYMDTEHYLDVQFRLLREDYIKPLRDGISEYLQLKEKNEPFTRVQDATIHFKVHITRIKFNDENIIHTARFDDKNFANVKWKQNKRFINGSLLCFSDDDFKTFYLATVIERKIEELSKGILHLEFDNPTDEVLSFSPLRSFVVVETSAYFEAYKHNLTVLSLLDEKKLPMKPYIIKAQKNGDMPAYIRANDCFDVRPLFEDFKSSIRDPFSSKLRALAYVKFENIHILDDECWPKCSDLNLDSFQYAAVKAALTKEFCVIQGPPGTGKTFIGLKIVEILLANKLKWQSDENPSPILVVCYTNHALDQFLEGLLKFTRNIVRIGGSCSNKQVDFFNLKRLRKKHENFGEKIERIQTLTVKIKDEEHLIEKSGCQILEEAYLRNHMNFRHFKSFMNRKQFERNANIMSNWLARDKNNEWKIVGEKFKASIEDILDSTEALLEKEGNQVFNLWKIPLNLRWRLYKMWLNKYLIERREILLRSKALLKKEQEELRYMEMKRDVHLCRNANIIGMTTTGAAKNKDLLQQVNPKIVVVEEAAEILESHIITSLSSGTQHVILIGDHQQLRPNPTAYTLAVNYDLNISLFERMIKNGIEYNKLNLQHRMRPEIASLLVPDFYEQLQNHESVEKFENIKGVAKNMFFMTHVHHETSDDSKTRMNLFEAKFIVALYRYLLLQGYNSSQITILTTYTGQIFAIKRELVKKGKNGHFGDKKRTKIDQEDNEDENEDQKLKVTVVDNYQGEENDIILLSLVRSNAEGSIGFLKTSNRVCVALSRAKKGFFAIGNFEFLANKSDLWKNITEKLKEQDAIGPSLQLKCQNHPDTSEVVTDEDFNSVSEGGCTRDCEVRLDCGHQCTLKCHPYDKEHNHIKCHKPCNKYCTRGHLCSRKCYEDCEDCFFMVDKVVDLCGHETKVFCHRREKDAVCPELCPKFFRYLYSESKVKGVDDNFFFLSCTLKNESMSFFVERFHEYLLLQGYEKSDVYILSQSDATSLMLAENKDLILAVFKGYPYKNKFLEASTEILIALSSAKKGLFCIGDFDLFAEKYDFWKNIVSALKQKGKIGHTLLLQCQNHPDICEVISNEKDFHSVKEGGCTKQCEFQLQCGHTCSLKCHPYDMEHWEVSCLKSCRKKCVFGHLCTKRCNEDCKCTEIVEKVVASCGHIEEVLCHLQNEPIECSKMCERYLFCGHKCTKLCRESCKIDKCKEIVTVKLPVCHHDYPVLCWMQSALTYFCNLCEEPCKTRLSCGHVCKGTCGSCYRGRLHIPCKRPCQRVLICGHKCPSRCSETCPPCESPCRSRCKHGSCRKKCGEPCDPCTMPCEWKCPHKKCNNLCSEKCDRLPCDEPCSVILKCGHQCIGFCGEPCLRKCRICDKGLVKKACHGIDLPNAKFVSLENCGHFFQVNELTEWMIQYTGDNAIQGKKCPFPRCNKDILNNFRFGNVIKSYVEGIETVKRITSGDKEHNRQLKINITMASSEIKMCKLREEFTDQCLNTRRSIQQLNVMENFVGICLNFECIFSDSTNKYDFKIKQETKIFDSAMNLDSCDKLQMYIDESRKWMTNFILYNSFRASEEQLEEFAWEAYRVALADKVMKTLDSIPKLTFDASQLVNELMNSLLAIMPFRGEDAEKLHSTYEKFLLLSSAPECEKMKIPALKSVSSSKGTWFSCQKGHVFSSIRCLETSEVKSCYECDPSISIVPTFKGDIQEVNKYIMPDTVNRFCHRVHRASSASEF